MTKFFYTKHYPYRWSSGPSFYTWDDIDYIASLERAKELAEQHRVVSDDEDCCVTTYGVSYEVD